MREREEGLEEDDKSMTSICTHVVADRDHGPSTTTLSTNLGLSSVGIFFSLLLEGMESVSRIPGTHSSRLSSLVKIKSSPAQNLFACMCDHL